MTTALSSSGLITAGDVDLWVDQRGAGPCVSGVLRSVRGGLAKGDIVVSWSLGPARRNHRTDRKPTSSSVGCGSTATRWRPRRQG